MKSEKQAPIMLGQSSPDMKDNKFDLILNPISLSELKKKGIAAYTSWKRSCGRTRLYSKVVKC